MYKIELTTKFKKDLKKIKKRPIDFAIAGSVIKILQKEGAAGIPKSMVPHKLSGQYKKNWECHIRPDLLIIWYQIEKPNVIKLIRIGSHSDLF